MFLNQLLASIMFPVTPALHNTILFQCIDHTHFWRKKKQQLFLCLCCEIEILVPILWYNSGMATSTLSR